MHDLISRVVATADENCEHLLIVAITNADSKGDAEIISYIKGDHRLISALTEIVINEDFDNE